MNRKPVIEVLKEVSEEDKRNRIEAENDLLRMAESLTNGKAGCSKTQGVVLLGITKLTLATHEMTRSILDTLPTLQAKADCLGTHKHGVNTPTAITIITIAGMLAGLTLRMMGGTP